MEIWDLFDDSRHALGRTHRRGDPLQPGENHVAAEVWTVDSRKNILVTLRDPQKETYPNKWENTGGSALAGETSRQAAVRELREETGIIASQEELVFLGTFSKPPEFVDVYLLRRDIPVSELILQPGETVDAKWVTLDELDAMIQDESLALPTARRLAAVREAFRSCLDHS